MFLKKKSDTFDAFRTFKAYAENLLGVRFVIWHVTQDHGKLLIEQA